MLRGVIYARYSCDKQTDNSIKGQVRECTLFAERNDIQIINVYADEAISGRTDRRPQFLKMFRDASQHLFDVIVVWKGDRFSRNRADAAKYKNELKKLNIKLLSATEANVTGPEAILMDGINEAFAEFYSVELAEKVNRGMIQNLLEDKFNGGVVILGYKLNQNKKIEVDENDAQLVKQIFDQYLNRDMSLNQIVKDLNRRGLKNSNGREFKAPALQRLLTNRKYIGEFKFKDQINTTMYPAIIDKNIFDKVQEKLTKNKRNASKFRAKEKYILTGKFFCGECGEGMKPYAGISGSSKHTLHRYYRCGGPRKSGCHQVIFPKREVEKAVIHMVVEYFTEHINIDKIVGEIVTAANKLNPEIERLEKALEETNRAIKNLSYALEKGLNLDDTIERLKELDQNKKAYQEQINKYRLQGDRCTEEGIRGFLNSLADRDYNNLENCMYLLNIIVNKILIYKNGRIVVILNIGDPDDEGGLKKLVQQAFGQVHHVNNNAFRLLCYKGLIGGIHILLRYSVKV